MNLIWKYELDNVWALTLTIHDTGDSLSVQIQESQIRCLDRTARNERGVQLLNFRQRRLPIRRSCHAERRRHGMREADAEGLQVGTTLKGVGKVLVGSRAELCTQQGEGW